MPDQERLEAWLRSLPEADSRTGLQVAGALAGRLASSWGLPPAAALPDTDHPLVDDLPDALLSLETPGRAWEAMLTPDHRRAAGSHYTPVAVAENLVGLARRFTQRTVQHVFDPAAGTGSFLLGAAMALEATGGERPAIVDGLHGVDLDPVALAIGDATLQLWCGGAVRPHLHVADALVDDLDRPDDGFDLVVGNPPFLGQLAADTARSGTRRRTLAERFGVAALGYVDDAALFLLLAAELVSPDGAAVLIVPQSILGSTHTRLVRARIETRHRLAAVWVEDEPTFAAAVDVCAPVIVSGAPTSPVTVVVGDGPGIEAPVPTAESWAPLLAERQRVPVAHLGSGATLGSVARVTAGFRQHFYGLANAVVEDGAEEGPPRLTTVGAIEPFRVTWGERPIRFAGRRWNRPVVRLDAISDAEVRSWVCDRLVPKVVVATQTRVVEAVVDPKGELVPSVPVISIESDELDPWMVAAAVAAPSVSAHLARIGAGTGLSSGSIRIRAADLAAIPLPVDRGHWSAAADHVREAQSAAAGSSWREYRHSMMEFGRRIERARERVDGAVLDWWLARLQFPA